MKIEIKLIFFGISIKVEFLDKKWRFWTVWFFGDFHPDFNSQKALKKFLFGTNFGLLEQCGILSKIMEKIALETSLYFSTCTLISFQLLCISPSETRVWCRQNYFFIQVLVFSKQLLLQLIFPPSIWSFLSLTSQFNSVSKLLFISHLIVKMKGTEWLSFFLTKTHCYKSPFFVQIISFSTFY